MYLIKDLMEFGFEGVQVLGQGVHISGQGVTVSGWSVLLIQYDGQIFCIMLIANALCNMRPVFTADQKGTLRFVRRQLWMWESGWKSQKSFGKEGLEGIGFLNGFTQ